jgi:hypothetical protein
MFTMPVHLTTRSYKSVKNLLGKLLPEQNSSHRAEAIARCLGFPTNSALCAVLHKVPRIIVGFHPNKFQEFLNLSGGAATEVTPHLLFAHLAIQDVIEAHWKISVWGYGFGRPQPVEKRWETSKERYARFKEEQAEFKSVAAAQEFLCSIGTLEKIRKTKTIRPGTGSYTLKHIAENLPVCLPNGTIFKTDRNYVRNGTLIAAALYLGFRFKSYKDDLGYDHINVSFNMSKTDLEELNCRVRPDSGRAQDYFRQKQRERPFNFTARVSSQSFISFGSE